MPYANRDPGRCVQLGLTLETTAERPGRLLAVLVAHGSAMLLLVASAEPEQLTPAEVGAFEPIASSQAPKPAPLPLDPPEAVRVPAPRKSRCCICAMEEARERRARERRASELPKPPRPPRVVPFTALTRIEGTTDVPASAALLSAMQRDGVHRIMTTATLCIGRDGSVRSTAVHQSSAPASASVRSAYAKYDRAVESEVRRWRFRPFFYEGVEEPVCSAVTFVKKSD